MSGNDGLRTGPGETGARAGDLWRRTVRNRGTSTGSGEKVIQGEVREVTDMSEVTIRNRYQEPLDVAERTRPA